MLLQPAHAPRRWDRADNFPWINQSEQDESVNFNFRSIKTHNVDLHFQSFIDALYDSQFMINEAASLGVDAPGQHQFHKLWMKVEAQSTNQHDEGFSPRNRKTLSRDEFLP